MTGQPGTFDHPGLSGAETTDPNAETGQPDRLLAGKYKSVDELERGYQNLFSEGQGLVERIKGYEAQPEWSGGGEEADRVNPADRRAARADPVCALSLAGIRVSDLRA